MLIQDWRSRKSDILSFLVVGGLLFFFAGWMLLGNEVFPGLSLLLVTVWIGYGAIQTINARDHEYLVVGVDSDTSKKIVENALQNKNIPFSRVDNGFSLREEGLRIKIGRNHAGVKHYFVRGTKSYVSVGPVNTTNKQLAESLKKRIRDGFRLTGLE